MSWHMQAVYALKLLCLVKDKVDILYCKLKTILIFFRRIGIKARQDSNTYEI
jgi:hypothetical protein